MNAKLIENLEQLGMGEKEAKVYLAAIELGPTTISRLAKKSGVKRTTVHEFIGQMIARGIIVSSVSGKRRLYGPLEPEGLERILERQKDIIKDIIPELQLLGQKGGGEKPKVKLYDGVSGLEFAYMEAVGLPADESYVNYSDFSKAYEVVNRDFFNKWIKNKIRNNITSKTILPSDEFAQMHVKENKKELRENIYVSKEDFSVPNETIIRGDKVIILSFGKEKFAVIIESPQIAEAQRAVFNLLWKNLKKNGIAYPPVISRDGK